MKYTISQDTFQNMVTLRRTIHQYPELSNEEEATSRRICQYLKDFGISYTCAMAKNGVVADIPVTAQVPYMVLRAAIDVLPFQEETDLEFSSTHSGVMHVCGHDGHLGELVRRHPDIGVIFYRNLGQGLGRKLLRPNHFLHQQALKEGSGSKRGSG